jgi:hypothetical protein
MRQQPGQHAATVAVLRLLVSLLACQKSNMDPNQYTNVSVSNKKSFIMFNKNCITKGQLISKGLFGILNSSKKHMEKFNL